MLGDTRSGSHAGMHDLVQYSDDTVSIAIA
jgi:hypothetical protein